MLIALVLVGCDGSGTSPTIASQPLSGEEPSPEDSGSDLDTSSGLTTDFLKWILPVQYGEVEAATLLFEAPFDRARIGPTADCLESYGFRTFADVYRNDPAPVSGAGLAWVVFPHPPNREDALDWKMPAYVLVLSGGGGFVESEITGIALALEVNPHLGVRVEDAEALHTAIMSCREDPMARLTRHLRAASIRNQFFDTLFEIESHPTVVASLNEALECVRPIAAGFDGAGSVEEWFVGIQSYAGALNLDDQARVEEFFGWFDRAYQCMGPVNEVRMPLRLAAREEVVEKRLASLLELQRAIYAELAALSE